MEDRDEKNFGLCWVLFGVNISVYLHITKGDDTGQATIGAFTGFV